MMHWQDASATIVLTYNHQFLVERASCPSKINIEKIEVMLNLIQISMF